MPPELLKLLMSLYTVAPSVNPGVQPNPYTQPKIGMSSDPNSQPPQQQQQQGVPPVNSNPLNPDWMGQPSQGVNPAEAFAQKLQSQYGQQPAQPYQQPAQPYQQPVQQPVQGPTMDQVHHMSPQDPSLMQQQPVQNQPPPVQLVDPNGNPIQSQPPPAQNPNPQTQPVQQQQPAGIPERSLFSQPQNQQPVQQQPAIDPVTGQPYQQQQPAPPTEEMVTRTDGTQVPLSQHRDEQYQQQQREIEQRQNALLWAEHLAGQQQQQQPDPNAPQVDSNTGQPVQQQPEEPHQIAVPTDAYTSDLEKQLVQGYNQSQQDIHSLRGELQQRDQVIDQLTGVVRGDRSDRLIKEAAAKHGVTEEQIVDEYSTSGVTNVDTLGEVVALRAKVEGNEEAQIQQQQQQQVQQAAQVGGANNVAAVQQQQAAQPPGRGVQNPYDANQLARAYGSFAQ